MNEKVTSELTDILCSSSFNNLDEFFYENKSSMISSDRPFADYMRKKFKEKGIKQQNVFLYADISEGYGYKIISEEKRTKQRDVILRICISGRFSFYETQKALILYGMPQLYPRLKRDAIIITAINKELFNIDDVNKLLSKYNEENLYSCAISE